ncbi:aminomethyl-transferring glycine dehydrogenase subunit GcvPB [Candidatus Microgenomates bacterium]|nr:aminomethyl-transferring glycine dehydrogenase subunit GcvPB [Candidatus Microgenomates bacterium]
MPVETKLLIEMSVPGRGRRDYLPESDVPETSLDEYQDLIRNKDSLILPDVAESDAIRHFEYLGSLNYSIDRGVYPLGSCTMKYNPRVNETLANLPGFTHLHPNQPMETVQGALQVMYELQRYLAEITGMYAVSLDPKAGAHGELTGILMIKKYHESRGEGAKRRKILIPDSAHGTNPATAAMADYEEVTLPSDINGNVNLDELRKLMTEKVAGIMMTLPSTLGLFDPNILEITQIVHEKGGLVYGDGANQNATMGKAKFGELGFDVVHLNLHKTFSTPHGGGGPGAGPVACKEHLAPFLPSPIVEKMDDSYLFIKPDNTIGKIGEYYGNFAMVVRAYAYIRAHGEEGLRSVSEYAVLNANYLLSLLQDDYYLKFKRRCMHEFVLSGIRQKAKNVSTMDIVKRLMDYGFHPPTVYFPQKQIVPEALMIEPTETESKDSLDAFAKALIAINKEVDENPEIVRTAPHTTQIGRPDESSASRNPDIHW